MGIHRWRALVSDDFEAVNTLVLERVKSKVDLIGDLSNYIIQSGGKRLRPLLVLLICKACQYPGSHHITMAALVEFFHTATLLHDDVIDESTLRRGRKTANQIWGSKASILVGDFLFTQYVQLALDIGSLDIVRLFIDMAYETGCGEIQQLSNRHNTNLTVTQYFEVIRAKTSVLFASSAKAAGMLSNVAPSVAQELFNYGLHLGNAYQLIDDALDFCSNAETIGKNIGDDLADGKATLPLLYALQHGTASQQAMIQQSIEKGTTTHLQELLAIIQETKAIEYTKQMARIEVDKAISALQIVPDSVYKEALVEIAQYALLRDH